MGNRKLKEETVVMYNSSKIKQSFNVYNVEYEKHTQTGYTLLSFKIDPASLRHTTLLTDTAEIGMIPVLVDKQVKIVLADLDSEMSLSDRTIEFPDDVYIKTGRCEYKVMGSTMGIQSGGGVNFEMSLKKL